MVFIRHQRGSFLVFAEDFKYRGFISLVNTMALGNLGKGMKMVMKLIGILIPALEMARYVFWIDTSQQNRSHGFVFKDKISKGFCFKKPLLWNVLPDNKASSPLFFTPSCQTLALS
jgi:hypothetical protein